MGARSALIVPLYARRQVLGALTFVRRAPAVPFDEQEQALAADLGQRPAVRTPAAHRRAAPALAAARPDRSGPRPARRPLCGRAGRGGRRLVRRLPAAGRFGGSRHRRRGRPRPGGGCPHGPAAQHAARTGRRRRG
ncbi:GAF domain-containing protein [Streptomyces bauhiniae]